MARDLVPITSELALPKDLAKSKYNSFRNKVMDAIFLIEDVMKDEIEKVREHQHNHLQLSHKKKFAWDELRKLHELISKTLK